MAYLHVDKHTFTVGLGKSFMHIIRVLAVGDPDDPEFFTFSHLSHCTLILGASI